MGKIDPEPHFPALGKRAIAGLAHVGQHASHRVAVLRRFAQAFVSKRDQPSQERHHRENDQQLDEREAALHPHGGLNTR